jgi:hypothetical protein
VCRVPKIGEDQLHCVINFFPTVGQVMLSSRQRRAWIVLQVTDGNETKHCPPEARYENCNTITCNLFINKRDKKIFLNVLVHPNLDLLEKPRKELAHR